MKRSKLIALLSVAFLAGLFLRGCFVSKPAQQAALVPASGDAEVVWTCSMHPQIRQPNPGKCPLCGMDLIPLTSDAGQKLGPREISMSPRAEMLAQIETAPVERRFVESEIRMVGKIAYDETRARDISLLADGVIERLFVNYEGVRVKAGDHLAEIYSPEVFAAQKELLAAQRVGNTDGARQKLRLLGVLDDEIEAVLKNGEARRAFTVRSPIDGVLLSKSGNEGHWLNRGDALATIADNSVVWTLLDAYESDLGFIHYGEPVDLSIEAIPGRSFTGRVSFISPQIDDKTRTAKVRVNVANEDNVLKPGMFVHATLRAQVTSSGQEISPELADKWICPMHPEVVKTAPGECDICGMPLVATRELGYISLADATNAPPLVIPATAPLLTGRRAVVYVAHPDKPGVYEGRDIKLGKRAGDFYVVESGLQEGEQVVVRGNMKIDSSVQLLGKPSMMNPPPPKAAIEIPDESHAEDFNPILRAYFDIASALADDNLDAAHSAATTMSESAGSKFVQITALAHAVATAGDLDGARQPFEELSRASIALAKAYAPHLDTTAYVLFCPMAFDDAGANWMQPTKKVHNPYFGEEMPGCGKVIETIGAGE